MSQQTPLEQVFSIVGNPARLAHALGITPWAVYKWNVNSPPKERCLAMQAMTNNQVTAEMLRPDINWEYERAHMVFSIMPDGIDGKVKADKSHTTVT